MSGAAGEGPADGDVPGEDGTGSSGRRRVLVVAGVAVAVLAFVGGVAVAASGGDGEPAGGGGDQASPTTVETTTTTGAPTTTTTVAPATTTTVPPPPPTAAPVAAPAEPEPEPAPPPPPPAPAVARCDLGPWGRRHPVDWSIPGPPGQVTLVDGPNWYCTDVGAGCQVSIETVWSDGVTATDSRLLTGGGLYTLDDGRRTTAEFWVDEELYCSFSGADYSNVWSRPGEG